ncbi:hypothetical protein MPH_07546 [Macrophomina phaseolina MS6]|uniref:Uncharacterized protein n=2 Tax=Macrophomina phaseolina TaxID=35725 RepID=K2RR24_MACPH|nr:hypothetical protein MPH_07546 [Macrophomina phaseolina MS6]KAH7044047.1 hypothetical protein B0J12DRAFT_701773 [Macrophomina phaseolina]
MLILANQIRYKIEDARVPLPPELVYIGLLCAAACHSVPALKTYLYERRVLDSPMPALVFARLVDGIVQNTPKSFRRPSGWRRPLREEHASAVMLGFPDAPVHEPYDLSSCVPRESWPCMDRWVRALARYKFLPQLRLEWALWLESPLRTSPQSCLVPAKAAGPPTAAIINEDREPMRRLHEAGMWNTRTRGDLAFVEAFRRSGGFEEAWMVLKESDFSFDLLKRRTRTALLAYPEFAAPELWTEGMRARMLNNYAAELAKIESLYGVEWVWDEQAGTGYHRISGESFLCSQDEHDNPAFSGRGEGS